jgi:hypothetical protein
VQARNLVDAQRRGTDARWWRELSVLQVWLGADGKQRGGAILNSVTSDELEATFGRRWPTTLRRIVGEELRATIYEATRPGVIADLRQSGRYQRVKWSLGPQRRQTRTHAAPSPPTGYLDPLPLIV